MVCHHVVLGRAEVNPPDFDDANAACPFDKRIQHRQLHLSLQNAAAHDPQVHVQDARLNSSDDHRDQPVVAEHVGESTVQSDVVRVDGDLFDLRVGVASGGQVELVGLVDELCDPLKVDRFEGLDLGRHAQRI